MPASRRGATRYFIGLVDSVVSASIWSVTRMVPISAAIAAPMRPATISPASTGPSSRVIDSTTTLAIALSRREPGKAGVGLQRQHHAGEDRGQRHDGQAEIADLEQGAAEQPASRTAAAPGATARARTAPAMPVARHAAITPRPMRGELIEYQVHADR